MVCFIGALIGGLSSLIGGERSNQANLQAVRETNKFNAEQAELNRQFQVDMWNRTNEYNSPEQQMQRLQAAGLNPNLVYGGNTVANAATTLPAGDRASAQAVQFRDALGPAVNQALQLYYAKRSQDMEMRKAELGLENQRLQNQAMILRMPGIDAQSKQQVLQNILDQNFAADERSLKRTLLGAQTDTALENLNILRATREDVIQHIKQKTSLNDKELQLMDQRIQSAIYDNDVKKLNSIAAQYGISPDDPWYVRLLMLQAQHITSGDKSIFTAVTDVIDYLIDKVNNLSLW